MGVTYTLGFSLQVFRMRIAGQKGCMSRIFEWFLDGNAPFFLTLSAIFNFLFAAVPIASLAWYTVPVQNEPLLNDLRFDHPALILILIRNDYLFLAGILVCGVIVTAEIVYCLKTNVSTFKVCFRRFFENVLILIFN